MRPLHLHVQITARRPGAAVKAIGDIARRRGTAGVLPRRGTGILTGNSACASAGHIAPEVTTPTAFVPPAATASALMPSFTAPRCDVRVAEGRGRHPTIRTPANRAGKRACPVRSLSSCQFQMKTAESETLSPMSRRNESSCDCHSRVHLACSHLSAVSLRCHGLIFRVAPSKRVRETRGAKQSALGDVWCVGCCLPPGLCVACASRPTYTGTGGA